jgi:HD-GYP domain-containing protein (c-di-GMP phosphodiesterase class II)
MTGACALGFVSWSQVRIPVFISFGALLAAGFWWLYREKQTFGGRCRLLGERINSCETHCLEVLRRVVHSVEKRDRYWSGHSENVGRLAESIARELNLPEQTCVSAGLAGQLHDIGLIAVPEAMLKGNVRLGLSDYRNIKQHSELGYDLPRPLDCLNEDVLLAVRHHHERMNGTGYPGGLEGQTIPLEARILAVADTYDAMTHDRPQRAAMSDMQALEELRRCTPAGYDPSCVEALARTLNLSMLEADKQPVEELMKVRIG